MRATDNKPAILSYFAEIPDPRIDRKKLHKLEDIFFMTLCAVICGADNWVAIASFAKAKEAWFTKLLGLENGTPSHDTFGYVFSMIDQEKFVECFSRWSSDLTSSLQGEVINIDGKCLRRSIDRASNKSAIHMVSAWAANNQLVLAQQQVDEKSNEITAIPKLLAQLDIQGCVVTMDAMGCQHGIARQIVESGGDYMLSLKGNQSSLNEDVRTYFESEETMPPIGDQQVDGGHGRIETRIVRVSSDIDWLRQRHPQWAGLKSVVSVTSKRETSSTESEETRYFISSLHADDPSMSGKVVRSHWGVENRLHWVLDCAFDEDNNRARKGHSAANLAVVRHIALNMLKADKSIKLGIKNKRLRAGWDHNYMLRVIGG